MSALLRAENASARMRPFIIHLFCLRGAETGHATGFLLLCATPTVVRESPRSLDVGGLGVQPPAPDSSESTILPARGMANSGDASGARSSSRSPSFTTPRFSP